MTVCVCCDEPTSTDEQAEVAEVWEHRLDGHCVRCATNRCDAYPGTCPNDRRSDAAAWQPLAAALTSAMTETGVTPDHGHVHAIAQAAGDWLHTRGYTLAYVSRCWCAGKADGAEHTPGCPGIEQDRLRARP